MTRRILTISSFLLLGMLVIGAGCGTDQPPEEIQTDERPAAAAPVIKKQPRNDEPIEEALDFCEAQGHAVTFVFDPISKTNRMYCEFQKNIGCDALDYYRRRCTTNTAIAIRLPDIEHVSFCPDQEEPVCGEDGRTYINQCIANQQQVRAIHDGPCTKADIASPVSTPSESEQPSRIGTSNLESDGSADTTWLNPLINLLSKKPNARIEECTYDGQTLYYQEESCPECFGTLYSQSGAILCFPHNDLTNECPPSFSVDARSSCRVIWEN